MAVLSPRESLRLDINVENDKRRWGHCSYPSKPPFYYFVLIPPSLIPLDFFSFRPNFKVHNHTDGSVDHFSWSCFPWKFEQLVRDKVPGYDNRLSVRRQDNSDRFTSFSTNYKKFILNKIRILLIDMRLLNLRRTSCYIIRRKTNK